MNLPEKVNCIIFSFGYAESNQVPTFIFSTDFFGIKNYSPAEALVTLADDWYHWYLEDLDHKKRSIIISSRAERPLINEAVKDVWKYCNFCCREAHESGKNYCDHCKLDLRIEPNENDFYDFLSYGSQYTLTDGFWDEYMPNHHGPTWDPHWKECGLKHIRTGEFLSIMESAEGILLSALKASGKHPEVFSSPEQTNLLDSLLVEIQHGMEDL